MASEQILIVSSIGALENKLTYDRNTGLTKKFQIKLEKRNETVMQLIKYIL